MKLLLADDHRLFREALVQYIQRSDIAAEIDVAESLDGALEILARGADHDLVVLDLRMPGMQGLDGFEKIRQKYPDTPAALISGVAEESDVMQAFDLGAVGYFPKTMSGKALLQAIKLVLAGERFVPLDRNSTTIMPSHYDDGEQKISRLYGGMQEGQSDFDTGGLENVAANSDFKLTPRENEVLSHLMYGTSNKEIASNLGLQVVTVKLHVRGICRKLDVKNRTQAALKARECGLVKGHS